MKVLVTGGCGFIGSNLAKALVEKGHDVAVLDAFVLGRMENISAIKDKIKLVKGNVRDEELVGRAMKGIDIVFHQAAASSSGMFKTDLKGSVSVNINGTLNLLKAAAENSVKRFIYASTSSMYGNNKPPLREDMFVLPPNFYSATKLMKEYFALMFSQEYGLETVGFRYMSVYGPNESGKGGYANLVTQFLQAMQRNEQPVIYGDGRQTRDLTYVKDVVQANMLAMETEKTMLGEVFNVGTGRAVSLNELVAAINTILGKSIMPKHVEMPVKGYIFTQQADISRINKVLGYRPKYSLEEGISDMISQASNS